MAIVVPWTTILKLALALVVAWAVLRLLPALVTVFVAVLLAMTLDPVVQRLERRRLPRSLGSVLVVIGFVAVIVGLFWIAVPPAVQQSELVASRVREFGHQILSRLPSAAADALQRSLQEQGGFGAVASRATAVGASVMRGVASAILSLALVLYLLMDGRRTYAWLLAYVPLGQRRRIGDTAEEVQRIVSAYVAGNLLTSVLAAAFVFLLLSLLKVPAALVLALLAGLFDFLPVIGFILSMGPALLLALTVSPMTALIVAAAYGSYHLIESYYITPKVYGDKLELSDVAVLLAFALGFELGGVVGAILALPVAAAYPAVERLWLAERLGRHVVEEHEQISEAPASDFTAVREPR